MPLITMTPTSPISGRLCWFPCCSLPCAGSCLFCYSKPSRLALYQRQRITSVGGGRNQSRLSDFLDCRKLIDHRRFPIGKISGNYLTTLTVGPHVRTRAGQSVTGKAFASLPVGLLPSGLSSESSFPLRRCCRCRLGLSTLILGQQAEPSSRLSRQVLT